MLETLIGREENEDEALDWAQRMWAQMDARQRERFAEALFHFGHALLETWSFASEIAEMLVEGGDDNDSVLDALAGMTGVLDPDTFICAHKTIAETQPDGTVKSVDWYDEEAIREILQEIGLVAMERGDRLRNKPL